MRQVKDGVFDRRPDPAARPVREDAGVQTDPARVARAVAWIESTALVLVALIGLAAHLLAR